MKLWLISQTENTGYDTYDSAVVCALTEESARKKHPSGDDTQWRSAGRRLWCSRPEKVTVTLLGKAVKGTEPGVICASFNAG